MTKCVESEMKDFALLITDLIGFRQMIEVLLDRMRCTRISHEISGIVPMPRFVRCRKEPSMRIFCFCVVLLYPDDLGLDNQSYILRDRYFVPQNSRFLN